MRLKRRDNVYTLFVCYDTHKYTLLCVKSFGSLSKHCID